VRNFEHIAGDTLDFTDEVSGYPPSDGWELVYILLPRFTSPVQAPIALTATTSGDVYRIQAAANVTAAWAAGDYTVTRFVQQGGGAIRQTIDQFQFEVRPDPTTSAQGYDGRSHARKMVDRLETALEALSLGVQSYTVAGRIWVKGDESKLRDLLSSYRAEVANEEIKSSVAAGRPNPRIMKGSFRRV
jgi:hypothetical protein